jgi:Secretion system C-terminal sorting domain
MKQNYFWKTLAVATLLLASIGSAAFAQYSLTAVNVAATENFNTLTEVTETGSGIEVVFTIPNLSGNWRAVRRNLLPAGAGSIGSGNIYRGLNDGTTGSGGIYSVASAANSGNRMLATISSGTTQPGFGTSFINNTGGVINTIQISYTSAQWKQATSGVVEKVAFGYSTTATSFETGAAGWTTDPTMDLEEKDNTNGSLSLDGYSSTNQFARSRSITGLSIPIGGTIWFRWLDQDDAANDVVLAIDDLSVVATAVTSNESDIAASGVAGMSVYANPTSGRFNVDFSLSRAESVNISLVDLTGATRQVLQSEQALEAGSYSRTVDTDVAPGLYFVAVETSRGRKLTKLVVTE